MFQFVWAREIFTSRNLYCYFEFCFLSMSSQSYNRNLVQLAIMDCFFSLVLVTKSITTWMVRRRIGTELTDYRQRSVSTFYVFSEEKHFQKHNKKFVKMFHLENFRSSELVFNSFSIFFHSRPHCFREYTHCILYNVLEYLFYVTKRETR